jgi:hypothetical protein
MAVTITTLALWTTLLSGWVRPSSMPQLSDVVNLDYSSGAISTFSVSGDRATLTNRFTILKPKRGSTNGIARDAGGILFTAINSSTRRPCRSCFEIRQQNGSLVGTINAPKIKGAPGAPDITDVAFDQREGRLFLSDLGQQAVYYYFLSDSGFIGPFIVAQNTQDSASAAVSPNGKLLFLSGGCGLGEVRLYTRLRSGYEAGNCFGIGTIALIGGSADNAGDVATPVDGVFGLVSISDAEGKRLVFTIPDRFGSVGSVAFSSDARVLYVADHTKEIVYAFAQPAGGWLSGGKPSHVATYTGFKALDIIAVR